MNLLNIWPCLQTQSAWLTTCALLHRELLTESWRVEKACHLKGDLLCFPMPWSPPIPDNRIASFACLVQCCCPGRGFPGDAGGKEPACQHRSLIPGSGSSPGGGHDNPLHYSCLENPMDRGAWRAAAHGVAESAVTEAPYQAQTGGGETAPAGCLLLDGPRAQAQSLFGDEKLSSEGSEEPWKKAQAHLL